MSWWVSEIGLRLLIFPALMLVLAVWEVMLPRRRWQLARPWRWISNLGLALLNNVVLRVLAPLGLAGIALWAEERRLGLLHLFDLPEVVGVVVTVLLLDLIVYTQHVVFHRVPILWRLHLVHHADLDFDFTTGVRFHTLEILLSFGIKAAAVIFLGGTVLGVVIFELLLTATSLFNHANVRLPVRLERWLRLLVVTPEMHRVHHSAVPRNSTVTSDSTCPGGIFSFELTDQNRVMATKRCSSGLAGCVRSVRPTVCRLCWRCRSWHVYHSRTDRSKTSRPSSCPYPGAAQ
jgi:sterol desaturase/sphingolipid hydroxylase (fatty acid hydroxylase superfamily)